MISSLFFPHKAVRKMAFENIALRQQLSVFHQKKQRPILSNFDRLFWIVLSKLSLAWKDTLIIVEPETVIKWHRKGFKLFWRWKSRHRKPGRPKIDKELRQLIRQMAAENKTWGAPQIHGQLLKLGYDICQTTVENYMPKRRKPPSQNWRTFLTNHAKDIVACDFFVVPTVSFHLLFVFIVLSHDRRRIVHFNVTSSRSAIWTGQQIINAFPYGRVTRFILRDRDSIYGREFKRRVKNIGIEEVITAYKSPWQNPYAERVIGSIRRDCLNHCIVLGERHLHRLVSEYVDYYNKSRTHLGLNKDCPITRDIDPPENGPIKSKPVLGGLHHRYYREAA
ncbi:MAG: transposase [Planctomycetes bacterium]|nr:transposase [Planctomycetota bacterium]